MDRAWPNNHQQTIVTSFQNIVDSRACIKNQLAYRLGHGAILVQLHRRHYLAHGSDTQIIGFVLHRHLGFFLPD
jgi:hypothetical protein